MFGLHFLGSVLENKIHKKNIVKLPRIRWIMHLSASVIHWYRKAKQTPVTRTRDADGNKLKFHLTV